jgi:hypothetical protein
MNGTPEINVAWLTEKFPSLQNIQPLSGGGQKQVFSAQHPQDGEVVLKLMRPNADIERIKRELIAVSRIQSTRVPIILEQGIVSSPIGDCFWFREQRDGK